jgi:hypothetical protein
MLLSSHQRCLSIVWTCLRTLFIRPSEDSTSQTTVLCQHGSPSGVVVCSFSQGIASALVGRPYVVFAVR